MNPSVLIAAPTSDVKDYCFDKYVQQLKSFTYPEYDTFIVDNSKDKFHIKKFWKEGINGIHYPVKGHPTQWLTDCQNIIRGVFLDAGFDYLFMLESDVFVPDWFIWEGIAQIEAQKADVYTWTYEIEKDMEMTPCIHGEWKKGAKLTGKVPSRGVGYSWLGRGCVDIESLGYGDYKAYGAGIGATIISRKVLESVIFRVDLKVSKKAFSDSYFYYDTKRLGFKTIIETNQIAEHDIRGGFNKWGNNKYSSSKRN